LVRTFLDKWHEPLRTFTDAAKFLEKFYEAVKEAEAAERAQGVTPLLKEAAADAPLGVRREYIWLERVHNDDDPVKIYVSISGDCPMKLKRDIMNLSNDVLEYEHFEITRDGTNVIGDEMVSLEVLGVKSGDRLKLKLKFLAGGKRGRADKTKTSRMGELREEAGTTQLRINAFPNMAPTITHILNVCNEITQELQKPQAQIVSWMNDRTPSDKLREMQTICAGTNSLENRFTLISNGFFALQEEALTELEKQIKHCKGLLITYATMAMVSQFGDEAGNIQWKAFTECLTKALETRAAAAGAAEAIRGLGA